MLLLNGLCFNITKKNIDYFPFRNMDENQIIISITKQCIIFNIKQQNITTQKVSLNYFTLSSSGLFGREFKCLEQNQIRDLITNFKTILQYTTQHITYYHRKVSLNSCTLTSLHICRRGFKCFNFFFEARVNKLKCAPY